MSCQLFIRPALSDDEPVEWLSQQQDNAPVSGVLDDMTQLNLLQTYAVGAEVILLAPGETVICLPATLPMMEKARLNKKMLKALPYQIEEQIIGAVDELYWATLSFSSPYYLAGISRHRLQQWQACFVENSLPLHRIVPDSFCLPVAAEGGWSLLNDRGRCIIRQHEYSGMVVKTDWLAQLTARDAPRLEVYGNPDGAALPAGWQPKIRGETLDILAHYSALSPINLLEKPASLTPKRKLPGWRYLPLAAAAGLIAISLGLWLSGQHYRQQAARLAAKNVQLYQALTHSQQKVANPRFHLMQRLKNKASGPQADFRQRMLNIAAARARYPEVTISRLRYSAVDNQLQLAVEGNGREDFLAMLNALPVSLDNRDDRRMATPSSPLSQE